MSSGKCEVGYNSLCIIPFVLTPSDSSRSFVAKVCSKHKILHILILVMEKALMQWNDKGLGVWRYGDFFSLLTLGKCLFFEVQLPSLLCLNIIASGRIKSDQGYECFAGGQMLYKCSTQQIPIEHSTGLFEEEQDPTYQLFGKTRVKNRYLNTWQSGINSTILKDPCKAWMRLTEKQLKWLRWKILSISFLLLHNKITTNLVT